MLSILTGVVMVLAGYFKLGGLLRFVSNSVMVGFISAVGMNIVLGQPADFTGYEAEGGNRIAKALDPSPSWQTSRRGPGCWPACCW